MRKIVALASIVIIFIGSFFDNNYFMQPNEIVWSDSLDITWSDFGGLPPPGVKPDLIFELTDNQKIGCQAKITTNIISKELDDAYEVKSVFYPGKSFYECFSKTSALTDNMLRHEIYHFHTTELHSRYMRQALINLLESSKVINLDSLENVYRDHLDSAGYKYDKFTRHGSNINNQKRTEHIIDSLLIASESLKSIKISKVRN